MSSIFLRVCLLQYCFLSASEDVVRQRSGHDAILPCGGPTAASITLLEWSRIEPKMDGYVFFYRNNRSYESYRHATYRGRVELREASALKDGEVSVVLRNASVLDSGTYECRVTTTEVEGGQKKHVEQSSLVQLTVTDSGGIGELREEAGNKEGGDKEGGNKDGGKVDESVGVVGGIVGGVVVGIIVLCLVAMVLRCKIQHRQTPDKKRETETEKEKERSLL